MAPASLRGKRPASRTWFRTLLSASWPRTSRRARAFRRLEIDGLRIEARLAVWHSEREPSHCGEPRKWSPGSPAGRQGPGSTTRYPLERAWPSPRGGRLGSPPRPSCRLATSTAGPKSKRRKSSRLVPGMAHRRRLDLGRGRTLALCIRVRAHTADPYHAVSESTSPYQNRAGRTPVPPRGTERSAESHRCSSPQLWTRLWTCHPGTVTAWSG